VEEPEMPYGVGDKMTLEKALKISDDLSPKCLRGERLTDEEWAVRCLAGFYRRERTITMLLRSKLRCNDRVRLTQEGLRTVASGPVKLVMTNMANVTGTLSQMDDDGYQVLWDNGMSTIHKNHKDLRKMRTKKRRQ
jgi:hypothetical protein